jgi:hypothetical protein
MRDRLIELLTDVQDKGFVRAKNENEISCHVSNKNIADYLLENGVIVTPCVAMVEQFLKDGKFDEEIHVHNGKYAVVYVDKSKWECPLIDITEQRYNSEKAEERIQALKGGVQE